VPSRESRSGASDSGAGSHVASRLAAIVESSDDAIIGKTLDGIVTSWNAAAERLFGYSADEMIGQSISRLVPDDRRDDLSRILETIRSGGRVEHF
jgi:PAS domain S-box-containing protein